MDNVNQNTRQECELYYDITEVFMRLRGIELTLQCVINSMDLDKNGIKSLYGEYPASRLEEYCTALRYIDLTIFEQVQELDRITS